MDKYTERRDRALESAGQKISLWAKMTDSYLKIGRDYIENCIGSMRTILAVAGPLHIQGQGEQIVCLRTTEQHLVAGINKGCKLIRELGGAVVTNFEQVGMTRAPAFRVDVEGADEQVLDFLNSQKEFIQAEISKDSRFTKLMRFDHKIEEENGKKYLFIKFFCDTGDAMGMNMTTRASSMIARMLEERFDVTLIAESSNWESDKKPSQTLIETGRGYRGAAQITIPNATLDRIGITKEALFEFYNVKLKIGSRLAGMFGSNLHIGNMVSAIYGATEQDAPHVVGASLGTTTVEDAGEAGVTLKVFLPAIECGTVGGGANLPYAKKNLRRMGLTPDPDNPGLSKEKFAKIILCTSLAGELAMIIAQTKGELASTHSK